jgi:uncharacterized protein YggE
MRRAAIAGGLAGVLLLSGLVLLRGQPAPVALPAVVPIAEAKKEPHTLRTSGSATIRIKADAARVFFGIQTSAATISEARVQNSGRVRKVMEALTALKIPDLKSKTSDVQVDILYGRTDGNQLPPITGYRVSNTFTVLVQEEDPAKLAVLAGRVLDAALENGANSVQQITFLSKEGMTQARRKALTGAVEDALANAKALAAGAKRDRIETVTIEGQPTYRDHPYYGNRNSMVQSINVAIPTGGETDAVLVIGDLEVTCQVNVTCTF